MSYTQPTADEIAQRRADLAPFDGWNERAFCQIVAWMGVPTTYLDLGSGTGAMVNCARKLGVDAYGVDVINGPEHWFIAHDLSKGLRIVNGMSWIGHDPTDFPFQQFDLITCLEVAEHLPSGAHWTLCETIANHLRPKPTDDATSGYLLFSAAPPGQAGEHHVGTRPAHEWRSMLYARGLSYRDDYTRQLAHLFGWVAGPASHWLAANLMVFDRGTL